MSRTRMVVLMVVYRPWVLPALAVVWMVRALGHLYQRGYLPEASVRPLTFTLRHGLVLWDWMIREVERR